MVTLISKSPEETLALGRQWGQDAQPGLVIALTGDLGAGKTQLVRGVAQGLGTTGRVHSPTFALLNEYPGGRLPLWHIDLYRLETREQVIGAGLEDYIFQSRGVTVIEWAERWFGEDWETPPGNGLALRRVRLETLGETERRIVYEDPRA
ncbi:MAG: tRNA (adenosine(37)-N6)-threonylcarbamoyltransferase complex ATPase subunit type 1 TsaE [Verrucomicrobiota bacterium]